MRMLLRGPRKSIYKKENDSEEKGAEGMTELAMAIESLKKSQGFFSFDIFIIEKMGFLSHVDTYCDDITTQMRIDAYHERNELYIF